MSHYLTAIGVGAVCGIVLLLAAYRVSEQFDRQLAPW